MAGLPVSSAVTPKRRFHRAPLMAESQVPAIRIAACNEAPVRVEGDHVLYWMIASRRTTYNFGLQRAIEWARELGRPLVVLEALRCDYEWASDRLHRFVLDGMAENEKHFAGSSALYYPYVEPTRGAGKGLLSALGKRACVVITDEFPASFLPRMVRAAGKRLSVRLEMVDSNGLLPLRAGPRAFVTAHSFRRFLQQNLRAHLQEFPLANPLRGAKLPACPPFPRPLHARWPRASDALLAGDAEALAHLPIDHTVPPAMIGGRLVRGGSAVARCALRAFVAKKLDRYVEDRNHPDADGTSGLSPYLHFGHISAHEVFSAVAQRERWGIEDLSPKATGSRSGWWGMRPDAEALLDQLVTWRELGFNLCSKCDDYSRYDSLPEWALGTLAAHLQDTRTTVYDLQQLETATTHDPLWNAAQRQLQREGRIHNYMRMLWGKKILEWSPSPHRALEVLIELNDKYALDGRDPNSYSGIFWILGRYDRPWGPVRPIFGTVRYMSSQNTARKLHVREYLRRHTGEGGLKP